MNIGSENSSLLIYHELQVVCYTQAPLLKEHQYLTLA